MIKWIGQMLLAAGLLCPHYMADGKDDTTLRVCEGGVANFTNDYETTGHDRLTYSFRNKTGHFTRIYEIETPGKKPIIHADYIHRFNRTSLSEVGFTLSDVHKSDEGGLTCLVLYSDGSEQRFQWTLLVEDSRKLNKPKIQSSKERSGCVKYNCSLDTDDTVEVDMYWSIDAIDRRNGSSLVMCEKNSSELIVCIIESFCDKTSEYDTFKNCSSSRKKRSTSTDITDDCSTDFSDGDTATGSGKGIKIGIPIGIAIGLFIAYAIIVLSFILYLKTRNLKNPNPKGFEQASCLITSP